MTKRRLLLGGLAALVVGLSVLALLATLVLRRFDTPEFREGLVKRAEALLGTEVRLRELDISLLRGVRGQGVAITNPRPQKGDLLTADELVLRHRLLPLLAGQVVIDRLAIRAPVLELSLDARGDLNVQRLARRPSGAPSQAGAAVLPFRLAISHFGVNKGRITLRDAARRPVFAVEDLEVASSVGLVLGRLSGSGNVKAARVGLGSGAVLTSLRAPFELREGALRIEALSADLAGGNVRGSLGMRFDTGRLGADVQLSSVDLSRLAKETKSRSSLAGRLRAKAKLEGPASLEGLAGRGDADVDACRAERSKLFGLIAAALGLAELESPDLEECRVEFKMANGQLRMPTVVARGPAVQLTGSGVVLLRTEVLDYSLRLALPEKLLARIPAKEVRAAFEDRGGEFRSIDFRVTGTLTDPKTDLAVRVAKAAAGQAAKNKLEKVLGKIF